MNNLSHNFAIPSTGLSNSIHNNQFNFLQWKTCQAISANAHFLMEA